MLNAISNVNSNDVTDLAIDCWSHKPMGRIRREFSSVILVGITFVDVLGVDTPNPIIFIDQTI